MALHLLIERNNRYVELLEQQQRWLIAGLQILYDRALQGQHWPGPPLDVSSTGRPAAHDILSRLDVIPTGGDGGRVGNTESRVQEYSCFDYELSTTGERNTFPNPSSRGQRSPQSWQERIERDESEVLSSECCATEVSLHSIASTDAVTLSIGGPALTGAGNVCSSPFADCLPDPSVQLWENFPGTEQDSFGYMLCLTQDAIGGNSVL